ncbi:MAG: SDR family NAD(P)-dependent oxidoreductase [Prochloraceae cyanobacterium]
MNLKEKEKVCVVTGGSSGVGLATAINLAKNNTRVFITSRSEERGFKAAKQIRGKSGNQNVEFLQLDLSSLESVRNFVNCFQQKQLPLDILVNNAGIFDKRGITKEGFELIWGTNYLGHFLLTNLLLEKLQNSNSGRIVMVSSDLVQVRSVNWNLLERKTPFNFLELYKISKLCLLLFTLKLASKFKNTNLAINAVHPGFVRSNISFGHQLSKLLRIGFTPEEGAKPALFCANSPDLNGISGKFFDNKLQEIRLPKPTESKGLIEELWKRSLIWSGVNCKKSSLQPKYSPEDEIFGAYSLSSSGNIDEFVDKIFQEVLPKPPLKILFNSFLKSFLNFKIGSIFLLLIELSKKEYYMERHLDSDLILNLCHDAKILEKVKEYLGHNVILWRSEIWANYPSKELISIWHQDSYPNLLKGDGKTINVYIALTEVNEFNGFKYIPSEYQKNGDCVVKMSDPFSGNNFFTIAPEIEQEALPVVLRPGEFVLFSDKLIHRSIRNTSGQVRLSITLRFAQSKVQVLQGYSPVQNPVLKVDF